ncbi:MAG: hypothetical protein K0B02_02715 [DPANN group archaeon]|nr:hypothetical protein [DPANN group archaeon]
MVIQNIKNNVIDNINKYLKIMSDIEKKQIKDRITKINSKYKTIISLKNSEKTKKDIDTTFFSFEDLPPTGKEYWFLKFVSTKKDDNRQLILMFGEGAETIKINKQQIDQNTNQDNKQDKNGYMTVWYYDSNKKLIFDEKCTISIDKNNIKTTNKQNHINYNGKFPKYSLDITKNNKTICNLKIKIPEKTTNSFEFYHNFKSLLGFALINIYLDFDGTLNGKNFKGKAYIQKVIVIGPFIPWRWGRIVFSNGSILTYYVPTIDIMKLSYKLDSILEFYDNTTNKKYSYQDIKIKKIGHINPRWIITADNDNFFVSIKTYSSHKFGFKKIGSFTYIEYLSKVTDIFIENSKIDTTKLGSGLGLTEDATGYIL